jgi:hypothetical protein
MVMWTEDLNASSDKDRHYTKQAYESVTSADSTIHPKMTKIATLQTET